MNQDHRNIAPDVVIGSGAKIYDFVNLYGCEIGDETTVGTFVEVQRGVRIGRRCKIQSHSFICTGVTIEDFVFVGHGVMFINDSHPRATGDDGELQSAEDWTCMSTLVKSGASIGSNATILGGVVIGESAIVGAGSVVTKDVAPGSVVVGNPARVLYSAAMPDEQEAVEHERSGRQSEAPSYSFATKDAVLRRNGPQP